MFRPRLPSKICCRQILSHANLNQNRVGSKFGGGGVAGASETNVDRRERLRKLALETIDLAKVCPVLKTIFATHPRSRTHTFSAITLGRSNVDYVLLYTQMKAPT